MAVQKNKKSRSARNMRRSHDAIKYNAVLIIEKSTGEIRIRHHLSNKGFYRGRKILPEKKD